MRNPMALFLLLALAGCSDRDAISAQDNADTPVVDQPVAAIDRAAWVEPVPMRKVAPTAVAPAPAAKLALDGEGLRVFAVTTGSSRLLPFGIAKGEALDMLEAVQGAPPSDRGENIDCGATHASWSDGLTVWFARDKFAGWSVASADSPLSTAGGLKVGATRAEVENGATVARIAPSSLGEEFTAGDVGGLLGSAEADARVTHLWAGAICIAR